MRTVAVKLLLSVAVVAMTATFIFATVDLPDVEGPLFCPTPTAACRVAGLKSPRARSALSETVLRGCWFTPLREPADARGMVLNRCLAVLLVGAASFIASGPARGAEQPRVTDLSAIEPAGIMPAQAPPSAGAEGTIGTVLVVVGVSLFTGGMAVVTRSVRRLPSRSRLADVQLRSRSTAASSR